MRDIRPIQPVSSDEEKKRREVELYEASAESKRLPARKPGATRAKPSTKPKFLGSKVPVAKIPVPDNTPPTHGDIDKKYAKRRPLFVREADKKASRVRVGKQERRWLLVFFGLVVILAIFAGVIFLPTAKIEMRLKTAPLLVNEQVMVGDDIGTSNKVVPGTGFFRELSVTGTTPVQNMETVGEAATGTVQIVNRTVEVQRIKERSRLVTEDGQLFYMQKHAIVPPNSSVSVAVEADLSGEAGNIEPQRLNFAGLDEGSQQLVYAEAAKAFTGGSGEEIAVVSSEDVETAQQDAGQQARVRAESEIRNDLPKDWVILEDSWMGEVVSFETEAKVGDKTPELNYTAQIVVRVMGYEQATLEEQLRQTLEERLDDDYMLFPGPISYTKSVSDVDWGASRLTLNIRVTHTTIPSLSLDTLRDKLAGRSTEEATEYLEGLPGVRSVDIELWPFWARVIPRVEQRISLELKPEKQP